MLKVNVITTGGTIEKVYSEQTSKIENLDSKIDRYLSRLRLPDCNVHVTPLMNKDSLEMTDADRGAILELVEQMLSERAAVMTTVRYNGSDGRYLKQALPELKVPIVLTGAMSPLGFEGSDDLQNLTESLFLFGYLVRVFMS
jgi:L-asparaginase